VNRKLVGALLAFAGIVLIAVAIVAARQTCTSSTYNGTGPPPPTASCAAYYWTTVPLATLVIGILLVPSGGAIALYPRAV
jgi:hypothetical protein